MMVLTGQWNRWMRFCYEVVPEQASRLLPEGMFPAEPECCEIHVAELSRLRPAGLPQLCGVACTLILYCLRTRFAADREPGLYCLRIDADPRIVSAVGSLADDFDFHPADITIDSCGNRMLLCALDPAAGSLNATLQWEIPRRNTAAESTLYSPNLLSRKNEGGFLLAELPFVDAAPPLPLCVTHERWPALQQLGLPTTRRIEASLRFPPFDCSWVFGERRVLPTRDSSPVVKAAMSGFR